jgi:hypothetical protein
MAKVNLVTKNVKLELDSIVRFQLITFSYFRNINLSELDLDCLTYLGLVGEIELTEFCTQMAEIRKNKKLDELKANGVKNKIPEPSPQSIRNVLLKAERANMIFKNGKGRKKISLNPEMQIQTQGNIVLNYKVFSLES